MDIKFRTWDKKTEKMLFTGIHVLGEVMAFHEIEGYISQNMCGAESILERWNDIVLMQYTGLKDKNSNEIYTKDICRILYTDWPSQAAEKNGRYSISLEDYKKSISSILLVKFYAPSFYLCNKNDACSSMDPGAHGEIEIIGNIYEHSDLLD